MKTKHLFFAVLTAATVLAACSEEDYIAKKNEVPLQITTNVPCLTRAAIEGTQLPEATQIGVSLFNFDGSDYDGNAQYKNVMYTKNTGWSTQSPIILSTTTGKAIACYPYSDAVADIAAIPVETASQTDYLYSDWVNDLSFENPLANFTMNHALCVVQLNIMNQSYTTGPGEVTQLSVASPALATAASLNAETGQLSGFTGQGDAITIDKAFTLTQESQKVKIIAIPTGTQGSLTVKVVVDGATSTVPVPLNQPFVQGKAYVVNLKISDSPVPTSVTSVKVHNIDR